MFQLPIGTTDKYCDGLHRRSFLQVGVAGMASVGLPGLLKAKEESKKAGVEAKKNSIILIWLDGGPSHLDMYDMKPEAPSDYRGIWRPIKTNVPGMEVTELFPLQAKVADKFSIVRSLHHDSGDHFTGGHAMLTGRPFGVSGANTMGKFPSLGSIIARERGANKKGMPAYVAVPYAASIGLVPGYFGGNFLGNQFNPYQPQGDPNAAKYHVQNLNLASGLTMDRLEDRKLLASHFDSARKNLDSLSDVKAMDRFNQEAYEFLTGPSARDAFAIDQEDPRSRDKYGRHNWGQSTLLARRLVEAGSTFVTVHFGGWDHHWDLKKGYEQVLPIVDKCVAALFEDLHQRGLLETTMVVLCGEFSRTPKMNDGSGQGTPGRDHWGGAMFCLMGGGGIQGGRLIGSTDAKGQYPTSRPVTPQNIHATIYQQMGIDPKLQILDHTGRPHSILEETGVIHELL